MTVVIGANGSGKSTLFDVFSFLKDALSGNVASAVARRGGFSELLSRGEAGPVSITVTFREAGGRLASYILEVSSEEGVAVVSREILRYRRGRGSGRPWHFVDFSGGSGTAITNENVEARSTEDGRLVLRFQDGSFTDPFIARHVSDGTIKMFAYLVLLHDPKPHPLLAVEEPENQLYPSLLGDLIEEFRDYGRRGGQVFVSTHSPDFLGGADLREIYWLVKENGFSTVRRASDSELLRRLVAEGDHPSELWRQNLFDGASP